VRSPVVTLDWRGVCSKGILLIFEPPLVRIVKRPGHYIRHSNVEPWIAASDGSTLFKEDATFSVSRH
jgi:hypothetical protein